MTEQPSTLGKKSRNKLTAIIAIVVAIIIVAAVVVIVVEEKKPTTTATSKTVVFYTWWANSGKVALDHLGPNFTAATGYTMTPYISPGAGGTNAIYAILSLIEAGKPPDTFQVHYGPAMLSYVEAASNGTKAFVNMGPVMNQMNITNNIFPSVLEAGEFNGLPLSMPVNLHQGAQLFFNPQILKKYDLPIPNNISTLVSDTLALKQDGVTPWIIPGGDGGWDQLNLWEDIFLGLAGNTMYDEFMYGTLNMSNPSVMHIMNETCDIYSIFQNDSYPGEQSMTWIQAIPEVISGDVAFQVNGNWYTNQVYDFLHVVNYPAVPPYDNNLSAQNLSLTNHPVTYNGTEITLMSTDFPNTSKYYAAVVDSVAIPTGPTQGPGLIFVKYFASYAGQKIWTQWKGVTFYDNVTTDWYNTPAQWYSYLQAKSTPPNDWVYQLSDGGLFAEPFAAADTAMTSFSESFTSTSSPATFRAAVSILETSMKGVISSEESSWLAANSLGLGYMGSPGHPFGGYLPYWANTSANRTASIPTDAFADSAGDIGVSHSTHGYKYVYISPFSIEYLENIVTNAISKL
ncbi:MAG: glucose ABC transporter substrate-binding protein GlcS [Thermoplasmatales archaeon]